MTRTIDLSTVSRKDFGKALASCKRTEDCYYDAAQHVWVAEDRLPNNVVSWGATIGEDTEVLTVDHF